MVMDKFRDKVAIVTGAASGIGRALSVELGRREAIVICADINLDGAEKTASKINSGGGCSKAQHLDVTKPQDVKNLIDETKKTHGRIDFIFNNAGIAILGEVTDMSLDQWQKIVDVNLMGVIYGSIFAYEVMVEQGFGHIVNTASVAGLVPTPMITAYCATKHGVVGLSNSLRAEGRALGVKVGVACPGNVRTEIHEAATMLNLDRQKLISKINLIIGPEKAARKIIRGVKRNKAIIIFPMHASITWIFFRISNSLFFLAARGAVKVFRNLKYEQ